jgi:tetratricopeptide (TPR) repeat protein
MLSNFLPRFSPVIPALLVISLASCNPKPAAETAEINPEAISLNDSAMQLARSYDSLQIETALDLWEQAIALQPDYDIALMNKLVFLNHQGRITEAMATLEKLETLQPENSELKVWSGIFTELHQDSTLAREKFVLADKLYKKQLNTLSASTRAYQLLLINYAVNLKFLGMEGDANKLLEEVKNRKGNEELYEMATNFQMLDRKELIAQFQSAR